MDTLSYAMNIFDGYYESDTGLETLSSSRKNLMIFSSPTRTLGVEMHLSTLYLKEKQSCKHIKEIHK